MTTPSINQRVKATFDASNTSMRTAFSMSPVMPANTPTANAFDWAEAYMEARRLSDPAYLERVQVVVVLMDGGASVCLDGTQDPPGNNCGTSVVPKGLYLEALEEAMSLRDSGVQVYTATFNTSLSLANNAEYYSSNACSWTATSTGGVDQNGCTIEGTNYAYRATTAVEFNQMIEDIINSISSITFNFLTPDGPTTAVLEEGLNRQITLPSNFSCPANGSFVVPLQLSFNGEGTVEISNLNLEYCPN
ncbi:MAG: hypothetical protein UY81_C0075G0006 [Candidatus Giovannonibacteria bacterium GW2011_GWA2_53_7]|uniref:VWFA domain-containing protein n=1 Tax=Candidatus Giovannonibacteria bacterium GW2011_GWA2_53_7 TaxID=1618650 RepID=A0A0G1XT66_9BACT|nr:MAG: hypothetical protein UY81_C0075G0006 [Candidatus Giovannonibacteria bacterium GW2011_GWA2_53_7]